MSIDPGAAEQLAMALLAAAEDRSVFWDIPDQNSHAIQTAQKLGFTRVRPLTRMRLGQSPTETDVRPLFGIADPAVG
jgi:hypothetical protein